MYSVGEGDEGALVARGEKEMMMEEKEEEMEMDSEGSDGM